MIGGGEGKTIRQAQQQQQQQKQKQRRNSVIQGLAEKLGVLHDVDVVGPVLEVSQLISQLYTYLLQGSSSPIMLLSVHTQREN